MKKTILFYLPSILLLLSLQCNKDKPQPADNPYGLPNATQKGADMIACRIGENNFIAKRDFPIMRGGIHNDTLGFSGTAGFQFLQGFSISIFGRLVPGTSYSFSDSSVCRLTYGSDSSCTSTGSGSVFTVRANGGTVTLTKLDTIRKIFSGTFNAIVPIPGCTPLPFTDGRFDINYY